MGAKDRLICAARAAWYAATEPPRLRLARLGWRYRPYPLVTVYIPTLVSCERSALLFERALPSVEAQSYRNFEIIVAGHDNNARRAEEGFWCGHPKVRVISVPRRATYPPTAENHWFAGPVAPANAALNAARGQWIARLDDDDVWTRDHLESLLEFAIAGDYEFVSAAHETHEGKVPPYDVHGVNVGGQQTWLYRRYLRFMRYNPDCWRKRWNRVNDTDLQDRFVRARVRMGYLGKVVAKVLPRPGENVVGLQAYRDDRGNKERALAF